MVLKGNQKKSTFWGVPLKRHTHAMWPWLKKLGPKCHLGKGNLKDYNLRNPSSESFEPYLVGGSCFGGYIYIYIYFLVSKGAKEKKKKTRESPRRAFRHALESQSRSRIAFRLIQVFRSGGCRLSMTWHGPETQESSGMDSTHSFNGKTGGRSGKNQKLFRP